VTVPLFDQGKVAGTLNVESIESVELTQDDLNLMGALSEHISIGERRSATRWAYSGAACADTLAKRAE
jgi:GAF domain-containing protein